MVSNVKINNDALAAKRWAGYKLNAFALVNCFVVVAVGCFCNVDHIARAELPDGASHVGRFSFTNRGVGGVKPRVGFSTSVGFTDFSGVGYQPVEIVFTSQIATTADLRLGYQIINHRATQTPDDNRLSVDIPIFVPQGTKNKKWIRYLPKWMMGNGYEVLVSQDGAVLPGFRGVVGTTSEYQNLGGYLRWEQQAVGELALDLLLITRTDLSAADSTALNSMRLPWSFDSNRPWRTNHNMGKFGAFPAAAMCCGAGTLPKDWRGYQRWDFIVLTKAAMMDIKARQAEWDALLGWTLCGGTLGVWDVESQADLESLFDRAVTRKSDFTLEHLGFSREDFLRAGIPVSVSWKLQPLSAGKSVNDAEGDVASPAVTLGFHGVALGAGKAIAVSGVKADGSGPAVTANDALSEVTDAGLLNRVKWDCYAKLMAKDVSPVLRRGVEPILGNAEYKKWLVPGVAQPPIYVLVTFLAIFVVVVGPVAYRRTTKSGRGYLMFVIAPVLAMVTTVSMFAYGLAADGFSTLGRIRQITWVDGATGAAGERVRETYFAPISPRAGLTFPADAAVFPVRRPDFKAWESRHNMTTTPLGAVTVTEKNQRFGSSLLPSREQKQFVSHRPRFDVGRLTVTRTDVKEPKCKVANEFKFRINDAVVRDREGSYWQVRNLEPGQSQVAEALTEAAARTVLGNYYLDHNPVAANGSRGGRGSGWGGGLKDLAAELSRKLHGGSSLTGGRFEDWLRQSLQIQNELPLGFFVAVCDVMPDVTAIEGCEIESSVHYVIGTLP